MNEQIRLSAFAGKKVCLLTRRDLRFDSRIARTAAALAGAGTQVTLVVSTPDVGARKHEFHESGYEIHRIRRPAPKPLPASDDVNAGPTLLQAGARYARNLKSLAKVGWKAWTINSDVYHASDIQPLPIVWMVAVLRRRPYIYEAREISGDREAFKKFSGWIQSVEGWFARRAAGFITTTDMRAEHFRTTYGLESITVVQNRPVYSEAAKSDKLRKALRIRDSLVICLYQGGLQQGRGLPELLEVMVDVPDACLVMLGSGNLSDGLQRRIGKLGLQSRVFIMPSVEFDELPEWTASADVGVQLLQNTCLNHYTTDSNKLFEYAMAGLPVLASDFPEIRKVVDDWGFGVLVDPSDHESVVDALTRLVADPEFRARLAAKAKKAAPKLDWQTQVPGLLALYGSLLSSCVSTPTRSN